METTGQCESKGCSALETVVPEWAQSHTAARRITVHFHQSFGGVPLAKEIRWVDTPPTGIGMDERPEDKNLIRDTSGVVFAEYTILLGLVTVIGAVAVFSLGLPLYQTFRFAQLLVALPIP